jgi:hypothetical protein
MHLPNQRFWAILGFGLASVLFPGPVARSLRRTKKPGGIEQSEAELKKLARSVRLVGVLLLAIFAALILFGV